MKTALREFGKIRVDAVHSADTKHLRAKSRIASYPTRSIASIFTLILFPNVMLEIVLLASRLSV